MRSIVTGGAGFIGSHLVDALIERGDEVLVIDNLSPLAGGKKENIHHRALFLRADIRNDVGLFDAFKKEKILKSFGRVDYVFHCAALPKVQLSFKKPKTTEQVNVLGTMNIIALAIWLEAKRFIYSSSSSIYGNQSTMPLHEDMIANPMSPYGVQKNSAEKYCQFLCQPINPCGLNSSVCLRYFNVYGPRQSDGGSYPSAIGIFLKNNKSGVVSVVYGGDQARDFTWVDDVVRANILAAESNKVWHGEAINIGSGASYSINQLSRMIGGSYTHKPGKLGEPFHTLADISKARELLDWEPQVSLEKGIAELKKLCEIV